MENKYFIPDIEDIHIGYECEIHTQYSSELIKKVGWHSVKVSYSREMSKYVGILQCKKLIKTHHIRVPYLTKEQIEAEGWKESDVSGFFDKIDDIRDRWYINWIPAQKWLNIGDNENEVDYAGPCKDINTFRKIIKLLEI